MSFTCDSYKGYEKGKRYEKYLTFVRMFGNAKTRYVIMKDENGIELHWTTTDYNKTYQNFRAKAVYRFTIEYIIDHNKEISIQYLRIVDKIGVK